ncbi:MAG: ABC transporter substrate-binding protein, partial [candidate division NC10 bacterium]|nr:ABC transporter substrate-binding protein [candidate division NC10 bacterium]
MKDHKAVLGERLRGALTRRAFLRQAVALSLAMGGGVSLPLPAAARPARRGGSLTVAWLDPPDTLDPHLSSSPGAIGLLNNLYNGILKIEFDGRRVRIVPDLAERWEMPDPVTHVLTLRRGVKFHTGEELTAEDVQWNQERLRNREVGSPHAWKLAALDRIEVLGRHRLKLTFARPYQFLPVAWTGGTGRAGAIVSRRAVEKHGRTYGRRPVGTGPFRLVEWREGDRIVLERHRDYFERGVDGRRLPYLDRVTVLLPRDPASAIGAIMTGELDGMARCPLAFAAVLRKNPNLALYGQEGNTAYLAMNTRRPPFDDRTLRQAVALALDRTPIIQQAYFGEAMPACSPISPPMTDFYAPALCAGLKVQALDLERARALRAKVKVQGEIEVDYLVSMASGTGSRLAELIQPMLARIGITARLLLHDPATWRKKREAGDFHLYDDAGLAHLDPEESLFPVWRTGEPANVTGYSNPEFDRLLTEAQVE